MILNISFCQIYSDQQQKDSEIRHRYHVCYIMCIFCLLKVCFPSDQFQPEADDYFT